MINEIVVKTDYLYKCMGQYMYWHEKPSQYWEYNNLLPKHDILQNWQAAIYRYMIELQSMITPWNGLDYDHTPNYVIVARNTIEDSKIFLSTLKG